MARKNSRNRIKDYRILAFHFGEYCRICGEKGDYYTLVIDHIDNDNANDNLQNLELLCRPCNYLKDPRKKIRLKILSPVCVGENMNQSGKTAEMEKNSISEPFFRRWMFCSLRRDGEIGYKILIDSGAEAAHCSQEAVRRYLYKLCSSTGWAETVKDENNVIYVKLKKPWAKIDTSVNQVNTKRVKEHPIQSNIQSNINVLIMK
jgi:hypothetical protein